MVANEHSAMQRTVFDLELLHNLSSLSVVDELVLPEEFTLVEGGQAVDIDLPCLSGETTHNDQCITSTHLNQMDLQAELQELSGRAD